jgi:hypothetical protein
MSDSFDRLVLLLAAANFTRREIVEIHGALRRRPAEEIVWRVTELRQAFVKSSGLRHAERRTSRNDSSWTVGERVARLLKDEASLSSGTAHSILMTALVNDGLIREEEIPAVSKKSFHDWVDRLAQVVPPREILRIATEIRNGVVGDDSADWLASPESR